MILDNSKMGEYICTFFWPIAGIYMAVKLDASDNRYSVLNRDVKTTVIDNPVRCVIIVEWSWLHE